MHTVIGCIDCIDHRVGLHTRLRSATVPLRSITSDRERGSGTMITPGISSRRPRKVLTVTGRPRHRSVSLFASTHDELLVRGRRGAHKFVILRLRSDETSSGFDISTSAPNLPHQSLIVQLTNFERARCSVSGIPGLPDLRSNA